jgi:hypothetical protein
MSALKVAINLALFFLVCCSMTACVATGDNDPLVKLIANQIVTDYVVKNGKLAINKGDKNAVENDNAYLLSALEMKNIFINVHDYAVTLKHKKYVTSADDAQDSLGILHYDVSFLRLGNNLETVLPMFENNKVIETYLPLSEAPTKCYSFILKVKLHLVCHYGILSDNTTSGIISDIHRDEIQP